MKFFRSSWGLLKANLKPNRIAVLVGLLANATAALLPVLTEVGATSLIAPVAGFNAVLLIFLRGWQQWEKFNYEQAQITTAAALQAEARAQATRPADAAKQLGLRR